MADLSSLTTSQTHALTQLRDLTNGGDDEVAISVLSSVDWDVERAAEMIFDGGQTQTQTAPVPGPVPVTTQGEPYGQRYEDFDVDDSEQGLLRPNNTTRQSPSIIMSLVTYPLHLLSSLFRFIFNVLRIPIPYIPFLSLNFYRRSPTPRRSGGGIERWIRELEEETGAVCAGSTEPSASTTSVAGPSTLTSRHPSQPLKLLPPFQTGSYESILRLCQSSFRIGCIILVSSEHDSTPAFKSNTLTNSSLIQLLLEEHVICWGGDVRDKDAYEAALKLGATTYPFVAFVGMQPSRNFTAAPGTTTAMPTTSQSTPMLTVLSRHLGASACTPTSLTTHLRETLIPRVKPYLDRTRTQREAVERERTRERELREAQDRAFEESKRVDGQRILRKMEEERVERERKDIEQEKQRAEDERVEKVKAVERERQEERKRWRAWFREFFESTVEPTIHAMRVAVRMPDGRRLMRRFDGNTDTLDVLYAYVDTELAPPSPSSASTHLTSYSFKALRKILTSVPISGSSSTLSNPSDWWGFTLVSSYPRQPIPWAPDTLLGTIGVLSGGGGGGQLVVEIVNANTNGAAKNGRNATPKVDRNGNAGSNGKGKAKAEPDDEDDGYETESSDED
ncbi:hypothetical protein BDP27DRAFT_1444571 [Rhodocollybia butyracea]|uniref:UBX domain-containing protein n=1 Tax=Rhodocollybia butyracea TaxID=206335 RepID=A0A9P5Q388_9AGAR|nr:hypothetical protein BDP27DRAFT_1444571 [Rhodocollybia butyracea]